MHARKFRTDRTVRERCARLERNFIFLHAKLSEKGTIFHRHFPFRPSWEIQLGLRGGVWIVTHNPMRDFGSRKIVHTTV